MEQASFRYSIGIDLGTSNSVLAFIDLADPTLQVHTLPIPQWETLDRSIESHLVPSVIFFPTKEELEQTRIGGWKHRHIIGQYGRNQQVHTPQRVITSTKSWLCHKGIDRHSKLLPWMSMEVSQEQKVSPIEASALILNYLMVVWDASIGAAGAELAFNRQHIVITVPASFDQEAQKLTLAAATLAGYPSHTRLLEEPQAAFYSWLSLQKKQDALKSFLEENSVSFPATVLVCDIGGGTTDLSLFTVEPPNLDTAPHSPQAADTNTVLDIQRVAVSDHLLLGGDNIDCAIAKQFEEKIVTATSQLSLFAWQKLTSQSRSLKEQILSDENIHTSSETPKECYLAIPSESRNLFTRLRSVSLPQSEILQLILEGFFPFCAKTDCPFHDSSGFRELGLPYAQDSAITRHIAEFCAEYEKIDALLFNGGALTPHFLQNRIREVIGSWQNGTLPIVLQNNELDKAVAKGAAVFGSNLVANRGHAIKGGAPHGYYLEIAARQKNDTPYLLNILPHRTAYESIQRIKNIDLKVLANQAVEFRLFYSSHRKNDHAGQLLRFSQTDFLELPPLQTFIRYHTKKDQLQSVELPIIIEAKLNSIGLLQVSLVNATSGNSKQTENKENKRWDLEFNLRAAHSQASRGFSRKLVDTNNQKEYEQTDGGEKSDIVSGEIAAQITALFSKPFNQSLLKEVEQLLEVKKSSWNKNWLRQFWELFSHTMTKRQTGEDYEAAWFNAAGFFLRPGYGVNLDEQRIQYLWNVTNLGISHPKSKGVREQYFIMWRRVAGGLDSQQQKALYNEILFLLKSHTKQAQEAFRMVCSFEQLPLKQKKELFSILLDGVSLHKEKYCDYYLWGLGRLLSRIPLYSTEEHIMPPDFVAECFNVFKSLDWTKPNLISCGNLFSQASRMTKQRALDISPDLRDAVIEKMRLSKSKEKLIKPVADYVKVEYDDLALLFGESLPSGIVLSSF
ncbi:MAG: Hsp70 family protein [Chitinivibrionales bacterium]|nr:Hsp70 family protein [Chitinivibrionales bacterium]